VIKHTHEIKAIQHARLLMNKLENCLNINVGKLLKENMVD